MTPYSKFRLCCLQLRINQLLYVLIQFVELLMYGTRISVEFRVVLLFILVVASQRIVTVQYMK
jgi:hypothetical protein